MDSAREGYLLPKPLQILARWSPTRIMALAVTLSIVLGVIDWITFCLAFALAFPSLLDAMPVD